MLSLHFVKICSFQDRKNTLLEVAEHNVRSDIISTESLNRENAWFVFKKYIVAIITKNLTLDPIIWEHLRKLIDGTPRQNVDVVPDNTSEISTSNGSSSANVNNFANPNISNDNKILDELLLKNNEFGYKKKGMKDSKFFHLLRKRILSKSNYMLNNQRTVAPVNSNQYGRITRDNARSKNIMEKASKIKQNINKTNKRTNIISKY